MVGPKNLQVTQLIPQAQLVVGLKLVTVAGPADTLKVLAAIGIPSSQSSDEPRGHDVVHMAGHAFHSEVRAAGFHLAIPSERQDSIPFPTLPRRPPSRPLPVHAIPRHLLLPRAEACLAVEAPAVTIGAVASKDGF